jgi:phospholipase C
MKRQPGTPMQSGVDRRTFLKGSVAAGAATLSGGVLAGAVKAARRPADTPLKHIIVDCQENRSFDHYYGYAPQVQKAGLGPPAGYSQPDGAGGSFAPYRFTDLETPDIGHSWNSVHAQWNGGAMDGFYTTNGKSSMGYYTAQELGFYYSLFANSTLCGNFFSSVLGPTWPNRFYIAAGTSGGITTNGAWGYGIFDYPIILDLLDAAGVTWKVYNLGWDSVPYGNTDNVFVFWERYANDNRTRGSKGSFLNDLHLDRLPQVSFLIPSYARGWDEHPPASVAVGMGIQEELVTALRASAAWDSSAYIITYDEHGGYFDHVSPPQIDAFGLGVRIPTWVISPWAKPGHIEKTTYDLTSILKFIERVHGLPTLASVNHRFDTGTPVGGNYQAAATGATSGPPAPPRDNRREIGDLFECFRF